MNLLSIYSPRSSVNPKGANINTNINDSNYYRRSAYNFDRANNIIKTEHVVQNIRKTNPIRTRSQLKTYSNSVRNHKLNNYHDSKKNNLYTSYYIHS